MRARHLGLAALLLMTLPVAAMAADKVVHLPFEQVVAEATRAGKLDGSVKFYLAGNTPAGEIKIINNEVTTSKRTNAFGKKDQVTCDWVLLSALISLQDEAKKAGANAVTDVVSNFNNVEYRDPQNYECHVGFLMSGVALKAKLAKQP